MMTQSGSVGIKAWWPPKRLPWLLACLAIGLGSAGLYLATRFGIGFGLSTAAVAVGLAFPFFQRLQWQETLPRSGGGRWIGVLALAIALGSVAIVAVSYHSHGRPWFAFALMVLVAMAISVSLLAAGRTRAVEYALPTVIVFVGALLLSRLWVFETVGGDAFFHRTMIERLAASAPYADAAGVYATYPLLHVGAALLTTSLSVSVEAALTIYTFLPFLGALVITYLVGAEVGGKLLGSWAALLLGVSRWYLYWGSAAVPMEAAFALFMLGVLVLARHYKKPNGSTRLALIVIIIVSAFLHPFSSMTLGVAFIAFILGSWLNARSGMPNDVLRRRSPDTTVLVALAVVVPVAVWLYHGTAFEAVIGSIARAVNSFEGALVVQTRRSTAGYELDRVSDNVLFGVGALASILFVAWFREQRSRRLLLQIAFLFAMCAGTGVLGDVLGLTDLLSFRWYLFGTPMAALLGAWLIVEGQKRIRNRAVIAGVVLGMGVLTFFGTTNGTVNQDAPWYGRESTLLSDMSADDLAMTEFLGKLEEPTVVADWAVTDALNFSALARGGTAWQYRETLWPPNPESSYNFVALRYADYLRARELSEPVRPNWWRVSPVTFAKIYATATSEVWVRLTRGSEP